MNKNIKKDFPWQYSWEKLLLKRKENLAHFLYYKKYHFLIFFILLIILDISLYFLWIKIFFTIIFSIIITYIFYHHNKLMYDNTLIIVTTRRVIKKVRNGIFRSHEKELLLSDIRQITTTKNNFLESIFSCWNIMFQWAEAKWNLYFKWISDNKDIWNYVTRILDYMKLNWHTDNISRYKSKKERKK